MKGLDAILQEEIRRLKDRGKETSKIHVLDIVCEKQGFSFQNARGQRQMIAYRNPKEAEDPKSG